MTEITLLFWTLQETPIVLDNLQYPLRNTFYDIFIKPKYLKLFENIFYNGNILKNIVVYLKKNQGSPKSHPFNFFVYNPEKIIHGIPLSRNDPLGLNYLIIFFSQTI